MPERVDVRVCVCMRETRTQKKRRAREMREEKREKREERKRTREKRKKAREGDGKEEQNGKKMDAETIHSASF